MKIDVTKIKGYEEMSVEEKIKALEGFEYEDNSEIVAKLKESVSTANSQAAEWKKKHNALLSEEEKAKQRREEEIAQVIAERDELKKEKIVAEYTAHYVSLGYSPELAASTAKALASGDDKTIFANHETFKRELESQIKADLMKDTPRPKTGVESTITQEQFDQMNYTEKADLYVKDKELYDKLNGGN